MAEPSTIANLITGATWRGDHLIDLGVCTVRLVTEQAQPDLLGRFSRWRPTEPGEYADYELWSLPMESLTDAELRAARSDVDCSTRAQGFLNGYYATDHFGDSVLMLSHGTKHLLIGPALSVTGWSYYVKYVLMRAALDADAVFLKAAAVVLDGQGVLALGRGGGGKTTFAQGLVAAGSSHLANSHVLLRDGMVIGVPTTIRVRDGAKEFLVDPAEDGTVLTSAPLATVCVIRHTGQNRCKVRRLSSDELSPIAAQFGLALNVYRLEEDLLDLMGGDYGAFARAYRLMVGRLDLSLSAVAGYEVDADMQDGRVSDEVADRLCSDRATR